MMKQIATILEGIAIREKWSHAKTVKLVPKSIPILQPLIISQNPKTAKTTTMTTMPKIVKKKAEPKFQSESSFNKTMKCRILQTAE